MIRTRFMFWLDSTLLISVVVLQSPRMSSLAVHEWLAIAFSVLLGLHLLVNWQWIVKTIRRITASDSWRARVNAALNGLLFVMMALAIFSGLAISEIVMPLAGVPTSMLSAWRQLHSLMATLTMVVVGLHVGLNWDWIAGVARKGVLFRSPAGVTPPIPPDELASAEGKTCEQSQS
jgi:hypothetical protein